MDFHRLFRELQSLERRSPEISGQLVSTDAQIFSLVGKIGATEAQPENNLVQALSQSLEGLKETRAGLLEEKELIQKQINEVRDAMN